MFSRLFAKKPPPKEEEEGPDPRFVAVTAALMRRARSQESQNAQARAIL